MHDLPELLVAMENLSVIADSDSYRVVGQSR